MGKFGVHSEVGKLRRVLVHRPDLSLTRLTPSNHDELLFDDVLWVERAQLEHDQFVRVLRDRGVKWRRDDRRALVTTRFLRDVIVAVVALVFSVLFIWYSRNTGASSAWSYWAPFILAGVALLLGVPVYNAQRPSMTAAPAVPGYR